MPKRKSSSPISDHFKSQRETHNQLSSLGDSMVFLHFSKMRGRTERWLTHTENQVNTIYANHQEPSRFILLKLDLLRWVHRKYFNASLNYDSPGIMSAIFTLLVSLGYIIVLSALYLLLTSALIWITPHAIDWFFRIE